MSGVAFLFPGPLTAAQQYCVSTANDDGARRRFNETERGNAVCLARPLAAQFKIGLLLVAEIIIEREEGVIAG